MSDFRFRRLCAGVVVISERGDGVEKHQHVQPAPLVDQFLVRHPVVAPYSAENGEGAVVVVGAV